MTSWRVQCNKDYHYAPVLTTPLQKVAEYLPSSWLNSLAPDPPVVQRVYCKNHYHCTLMVTTPHTKKLLTFFPPSET